MGLAISAINTCKANQQFWNQILTGYQWSSCYIWVPGTCIFIKEIGTSKSVNRRMYILQSNSFTEKGFTKVTNKTIYYILTGNL